MSGDAGDVSPSSIVEVLNQVRIDGLPAVFIEPQFRSSVVMRAAEDANVEVGTIYAGLSDTGPITYIEMMRVNAQNLVDLLK